MSDRKHSIRGKNIRFFNKFDKEVGINGLLVIQLGVISLIGFSCNMIAWAIWLRPFFSGDSIDDSFRWFVLFPFLAQLVVVILLEIVRRVVDKGYLVKIYPVLGSICYSTFFTSMIYFYRNTHIFWLFAVCPMLLAAFHRRYYWLFSTLAVTCAEMTIIVFNAFEIPGYSTFESPMFMQAANALVIALLVASFTVALHSRIEVIISDIAEAEAIQQAKNSFFAKMSHEIRTPINAILGMDEMILREEKNPDIAEYAVNINRAGQSLLAIINDILDSSKLEAGHIELVPANYDLMSLLYDCYNLVSMRAADKGLEFRVVNDVSIPRNLLGDEVRIKQIITNLLTNAVKYTNDGYVEMNVSWLKHEDDDMDLIVAVKDTGRGIHSDDINLLFKTFERLDLKDNKYVEGTGLGLSITKQLVEMMDGTITVESKPDEGSVFTVTIPQKIVGATALGDFNKNVAKTLACDNVYQEKFISPESRLLVVDDVKMNIDVFKGLLKKTQVKIDAASSGEAAVALAQKNKYDIIFMDHLMPGMDGVEAFKKIREESVVNKETPVVVLTANAGPEAEEEYTKTGFAGYLSKPVKGKILEETIYKFLTNGEE